MKNRLARMMRRFGQDVTVIPKGPGEVFSVSAFLQPVRKGRDDPPYVPTPLGTVNEQRWLYIGPPDPPLFPGDRVRCGETYLTVQETVSVRWAREALYRRAVLRQEKEAAV